MYEYVHRTLLPKLHTQEEEDTGDSVSKAEVMKQYGLGSL